MRAAMVAAVAFAMANAAWSAWRQGWTYDEPVHLEWTERMLDTGVTERASVRRYASRTPATLPNVLLRKGARWAGISDPSALRFAARLPSVAWLAVLLLAVFALARPAFGDTAAMLAVTAAALDPNLAAHASVATVDEACAATVVATLASAAAYFRAPCGRRAAAVGLSFGLAVTVKFSALFLVAGLAIVPFAFRGRWRPARRDAGHLVVALGVAWLVVASWYLFLDVGRPIGAAAWCSRPFQSVAALAPRLRAPLPMAFLAGIDRSLAEERGEWNTIILGRRYPRGAWFYFLVLWLVKTPVLLLGAELVGLAAAVRRLAGDPVVRVLAWNVALHLAYFSLVFHMQLGYRFALMVIPLAYTMAAAGLAQSGLTPLRRRWLAVAAAVALTENAAYFGNPLSFTNAAVWPKRLAYRLVADSNIDWGQGRERLPEILRRAGAPRTILDPLHVLPGHITLPLNAVAGVSDFEQHRWLRDHLEPGGHFGHTFLWYDVSNDAFDRFLTDERRLEPRPLADEWCPAELTLEHRPPGERVPLSLRSPPAPGDGWTVCVQARRGVDIGFRAVKGSIRFGRFDGDGNCAPETMVAGQVSWYRLAPGRHVLCIVEVPNRRTWLPYSFEGTWLLRGHGADLGLRRQSFTERPAPLPGSTIPRSWSPRPRRAG